MKRALWVAAGVCVALAGLAVVAHGQMSATVKTLVETERAFAQMSVAKGTQEAYLQFLADDSLLFRPGPVPGKMFTRNRPAPPGKLVWAPMLADAASSGDLGYTTGPFEFRKGEMTEPPSSYGHYVSVWRKQKDGQWRMEVSLTTSHEKFAPAVADVKEVATPPEASGGAKPAETKPAGAKPTDAKPGATKPAESKPAATGTVPAVSKPADPKAGEARPSEPTQAGAKPPTSKPGDPKAPGSAPAPAAPGAGQAAPPATPATPSAPPSPAKLAEQALKDVDLAFAKLVADQGPLKAFQATTTDGVRLYRDGLQPAIGKAAIEKIQPNALGSSWQTAHARVSASGDFGYTTGLISLGPPPAPGSQAQPHYYVRIWRKDKAGTWKVEADIVN